MKQHPATSRASFTLIELIVSLAILGLVLMPIYEFLRQGTQAWETGNTRTEVMQNARMAASFLTDELRNALTLYTVQPRQVRFWFKDLNSNKIADTNEIITYAWSGTVGESLTRKLDSEGAAAPVAMGVEACALSYWNATGAATTVLTAVRVITLDLKIAKQVRNQKYQTALRAGVFVRNSINW